MARPSPSMALLLLAASALLLAAPAFAATADMITGMQAACNTSFGIGYPGDDTKVPKTVLSAEDCRTCVADIGALADDSNMYACYSLCQNPAYFPEAANQEPLACKDCVEHTSAYGCQTCMENHIDSNRDRDACFRCLASDPTHGKDPAYMWACAQCYLIKDKNGDLDNRAVDQCKTCISTATAQLTDSEYQGILSDAEADQVGKRPNDFGKCVYLANYTANVNNGLIDFTGTIFATCSPTDVDTSALPPAACVGCMQQAQRITGPSPVYPDLPRDYACSAYCQNPKYNGNDATIATACVNCVTAPVPADPWACSTCMTVADVSSCYDCLASDPYRGKVSNYNWACSMCAEIESEDLRNMCYTCIKSQVTPPDNTTSAGICDCVNLVLNNTIAVDRNLDAVQRSCFAPKTFYNATGALVIPDIPWGVKTAADGKTKDGSDCLACMDRAGDTKRYACTQYCQDPNLVHSYAEGAACASCVESAADPWGCQNCMATISGNPAQCFSCVATRSRHSSHNWACGQCGTISDWRLVQSCYKCVNDDRIDPCLCVDQAKNGTVYGTYGGYGGYGGNGGHGGYGGATML